MGDSQYPINLTEQEREKLESIVSYGRHSAQKITRARILLKADDGESDSAIAEALDCSRSTAWRTRKKFHERDRLDAIERKPPDRDYEEKLDGRDEAYLIRLACSEPPDGRSRWTLRVLADKLEELDETDVESVSHETIRQTLKKTNCSLTDPNNG
jgi:transposase